MRTIVLAFIFVLFVLLAVMAAHGLDVSSRHSARVGGVEDFEPYKEFVDIGNEKYEGVEPPGYAR